jgi:hypothetical protein
MSKKVGDKIFQNNEGVIKMLGVLFGERLPTKRLGSATLHLHRHRRAATLNAARTGGIYGQLLWANRYWQLLLLALADVRNEMLAGGKLTRPARVGPPESCGKSPSLLS